MVLGINMREAPDLVKTYITKHRLTFPHLLDAEAKVTSMFAVPGTPTTFLIDREGQVLGVGISSGTSARRELAQNSPVEHGGSSMYDLLITNGLIIDGTGSAPYRADVAVSHGDIVAIGSLPGTAQDTLDAAGLVVAPGFIDLLCPCSL